MDDDDYEIRERNTRLQREREQRAENERILSSVVRFLLDGDEKDAASLLLACDVEISEEFNPDLGSFGGTRTRVKIAAQRKAYDVLNDGTHPLKDAIGKAFYAITGVNGPSLDIMPLVNQFEGDDWRVAAKRQIASTDGIHNQAAERWSSGIIEWQGLRFRSQAEVRIATALEERGILFLPNCRGRVGPAKNRQTLEADFFIYFGGKMGILEVDGQQHVAAKDHDRDAIFRQNGVSYVRHFTASECYATPDNVVRKFLEELKNV